MWIFFFKILINIFIFQVKSAASYALGNIALGNLSEYLPFILHEIETQPRRQYLLLHSLKEVISAVSTGEDSIKMMSVCPIQ